MTDRRSLSAFMAAIKFDRWNPRQPVLDDFRWPLPGEIWLHTASQTEYTIQNIAYDAIHDARTVIYRSFRVGTLYTRQMTGHPKAFISLNEKGEPRFVRVQGVPRA